MAEGIFNNRLSICTTTPNGQLEAVAALERQNYLHMLHISPVVGTVVEHVKHGFRFECWPR